MPKENKNPHQVEGFFFPLPFIPFPWRRKEKKENRKSEEKKCWKNVQKTL